MVDQSNTEDFGANSWLVEEMYERYRDEPETLSPAWREFFSDYKPVGSPKADPTGELIRPSFIESPDYVVESIQVAAVAATKLKPKSDDSVLANGKSAIKEPISPEAPPRAARPMATFAPVEQTPLEVVEPEPLRGVSSVIATNMEASLTVPTATSVRQVPAKLLEVNRKVINGYRERSGESKISFTHLIGYAVVRAIADAVPNMKHVYSVDEQGKPQIKKFNRVNMGLAVDVDKGKGQRSLVVPVLRNADTLDFAGFLLTYEDIIRKVRANKLTLDDFQGANVSLTNPGTIGTQMSVPRLMAGQGLIVGVGTIDYPAEFQGSDERALGRLGVSKVVTITSTYDHRIIQGAESGMFLKYVHELLTGEHNFYADVFSSLGVPYESVKWRDDSNSLDSEDALLEKQMQIATLIRVHRVRGHLIADLDPLHWRAPRMPRELDPATYGLTVWDLDREFLTGGVGGVNRSTLGELLGVLRDAYCRTIGVEYMHIQNTDEQRWVQEHFEGVKRNDFEVDKIRILERLNSAEAFERFLSTKYVGTKRFGLEGAESAIPILDKILNLAADAKMDGTVIGMAHRGRLNVLANVVGKEYDQIFQEFEGYVDPSSVQGSGDVKYHLGAIGEFVAQSGSKVHVELVSNPSHLETVNPVVLGTVRAMQDQIDPPLAYSVLPLAIHGDAAFAGQGVVAECLAMSDTSGYRVGGTIHLIIDNQIGFTTSPEYARSSQYCSDVAKTVQAPIFHVNGDDPEACVRVAQLAFEYRQAFNKDVVIDLICYRRRGHNEGDEPSFTQPVMYKLVDAKRSTRKLYTEALIGRGDITVEEAEEVLRDYQQQLEGVFTAVHNTEPQSDPNWKAPVVPAPETVNTSVSESVLGSIAATQSATPSNFTVHPKLLPQLLKRTEMLADGTVDWAAGEMFAFGSLLLEGHPIRMSGQDVRRGTFSNRHAVVVDKETGADFFPLRTLVKDPNQFHIYDSLLSEYAVMGFEYGYSVERENALVIWEAQFGDFANGAQTIVDEFISSALQKWGERSSVVLLLPHGYEGQGPDHSSGRIERFLALCAEQNMTVAQPSTPASYFHLLRWHMKNPARRPLIVFEPKSMLRLKAAASGLTDFTSGTFKPLIPDPKVSNATRLIFTSGKVYYDLIAEREKLNEFSTAIVRVEQLYPLPVDEIIAQAKLHPKATLLWVQDEPANQGPWPFVALATTEAFAAHEDLAGRSLRRVSRRATASPATGNHHLHEEEEKALMTEAFTR